MIKTSGFTSPEQLAEFSASHTAVFLLVGTKEECIELAERLQPLLLESEISVHINPDAGSFRHMEETKILPGLGVWSAKGTLIGYQNSSEPIEEFLKYSREYC